MVMARYLVPLLILGWLFQKLWRDDQQSIVALYENANNWPQLLLALSVYLAAIIGTFLRWYLLVIALRLPFRKADAIRLGFIGYLLQFVSLGSVGGDVFKAVFVAKEQPNRKPEAVATILVDRVIGLFSLTILACVTFGLLSGEELGKLRNVRDRLFRNRCDRHGCFRAGLMDTAVRRTRRKTPARLELRSRYVDTRPSGFGSLSTTSRQRAVGGRDRDCHPLYARIGNLPGGEGRLSRRSKLAAANSDLGDCRHRRGYSNSAGRTWHI